MSMDDSIGKKPADESVSQGLYANQHNFASTKDLPNLEAKY
jgi:hypothetical protein